MNSLAKGGGKKKRFQCCLNPSSSNKFLCVRAIQGHSGDNFVDPILQDNIRLPDDFAEYIYHIGNAFEMHSIIQSGLIPGGKSFRRDRQSVFFTAVNPMDTRQDRREVEYDVDKPRIAPYKHNWRAHHNTVYWCNLNLAQRKGLRVYQTRSHAITLSNTLPVICIEKVVCMKTVKELYCKIHQSTRLPRVTLVSNSQHVQKHVLITDSRKSYDRKNEVHEHTETCGSICVEFRITGIPHSAVEQLETNRKEKVRRSIEQFENHPNRNMLVKNFEKSEEINHFSQESKDLITDMGNNEIFDFHETSSKRQCPDCAAYWEIGVVFCTCGKCMRPTEKNRRYSKDNYDSLSIPGNVMKKNQSRGPWHGSSMRQTLYHKARDMLKRAKLPKEWFVPNDSGNMVQR